MWIANGGYLLFTDGPENTLDRWSRKDGLSIFVKPSGYAGPPDPALRETGANGLALARDGKLLLADSGDRAVVQLDLASRERRTLVSTFSGQRLNSPNDLVQRSDGSVYFTDPPYGLAGLDDSPVKQLQFNGVFRLASDGALHIVDDRLRFPNGIALSPDEKTLYVSNSDPKRPLWMAYTLDDVGNAVASRIFADAADLIGPDAPGLPDGMAVTVDGHLFASAPGGVLVFSPDGHRLGRITTGSTISNCAFGDDGRTLYLTSHHILARVRLAKGLRGLPK